MERTLGELRSLLEEKRSLLEKLLARRDAIAVERSADPSDEAQSALDRDLTVRVLDRESSLLSAIRFALRRIEDGTYGVCQSCDENISPKRLAAMPWAIYCIRCQENTDHARGGRGDLPVPILRRGSNGANGAGIHQ